MLAVNQLLEFVAAMRKSQMEGESSSFMDMAIRMATNTECKILVM